MRLTPYEVTQLLADLESIIKRDDSAALKLTLWLRDRQDEAVHIYQESMVMWWKEHNPLVQPADKAPSSSTATGCDG
jgi:hypothetical protein